MGVAAQWAVVVASFPGADACEVVVPVEVKSTGLGQVRGQLLSSCSPLMDGRCLKCLQTRLNQRCLHSRNELWVRALHRER